MHVLYALYNKKTFRLPHMQQHPTLHQHTLHVWPLRRPTHVACSTSITWCGMPLPPCRTRCMRYTPHMLCSNKQCGSSKGTLPVSSVQCKHNSTICSHLHRPWHTQCLRCCLVRCTPRYIITMACHHTWACKAHGVCVRANKRSQQKEPAKGATSCTRRLIHMFGCPLPTLIKLVIPKYTCIVAQCYTHTHNSTNHTRAVFTTTSKCAAVQHHF